MRRAVAPLLLLVGASAVLPMPMSRNMSRNIPARAPADKRTANAVATRDGFAEALVSRLRAPDITAAEDIYAPLLGAWDVDTRDYLPEGAVVTGRGEWLFARVLEGRAVQDVFIVPARGARGPGGTAHPRTRYGSSVRTLDPTTRRWQVTWFNPVSGAFDVLHARAEGGRIVQEGRRPDGQRIRWVFDVLAPARFHWYGEAERPDGSWAREVEFTGTRRAAAGSA